MKQLCLQADASYAGVRIDKYLAEVMSDYSRSFLTEAVKRRKRYGKWQKGKGKL